MTSAACQRHNEFIERLARLRVNDPDEVDERLGEGFAPEYADLDRINATLRPRPRNGKPHRR